MKPIYNIRMKDGGLLPDAQGAPYRFHSLAEARGWAMPGEQVVRGQASWTAGDHTDADKRNGGER